MSASRAFRPRGRPIFQNTEIRPRLDLTDRGLVTFFKGWRWHERPQGQVQIDLQGVEFVAPWFLTMVGAWALWAREKRGKRPVLRVAARSLAGDYVGRAGFPELLGLDPVDYQRENEERTVRLRAIARSADIHPFAEEVMNVLGIDDEEVASAIKYSLVELLRNVVQHSQSPIGGVCMAQYFPSKGLAEIAVADAGIGVLATLRERYPEIRGSSSALRFATQPHVSGTFPAHGYSEMRDNAGLGLFFIKEIAARCVGRLYLASGEALLHVRGDEAGQGHTQRMEATAGGWPGTFALVQVRTAKIADFESVLRTCRELAAAAREYPAEQAIEFLDKKPALGDMTVIQVKEFEENVEEAARVRDSEVLGALRDGRHVLLDFTGVGIATQSFVHALLYKVLREAAGSKVDLSLSGCTESTREAIRAVAAYARVAAQGESGAN